MDNAEGSSTPLTHFPDIHPRRQHIISDLVAEVFGIPAVCEWQVESINHVLSKESPLTFINRRTADGKSLVVLSFGAFKRNHFLVVGSCCYVQPLRHSIVHSKHITPAL